MINIIVRKEFTDAPGPRYIYQGEYSGELFRNEYLIPKMKEALEKKAKLFIDLDGTFGYPTSFLEESFGGLAEIYDKKVILDTIIFKSDDELGLIDEIKEYIVSDERKQK